MSLYKAIKHGKEHRKPYRGSKAIDKSCRNHGDCEWCEEDRKYKNLKRLQECIDKYNEMYYNDNTNEREI